MNHFVMYYEKCLKQLIFYTEAQIFRMLVTNRETTLKESTRLMDSKFVSMFQGHFPDTQLSECIQFVLQYISLKKERNDKQHANLKQVFITYTGMDLIQEATEGNNNF